MRADDPWPWDMELTIETEPHALLELLWIREAWGLAPVGPDLPPPLVDPPARLDGAPDARWAVAWPLVWDAVLEHAAVDRAPLMSALEGRPEGSPERAELLRRIIGPSWRSIVDDRALPAEFTEWAAARFDHAEPPQRLAETPERVCIDAVVPAWRAGLTTVVTVPCTGEHTRRIGGHALVVTDATRAAPGSYRRALHSFVA